MRILLVEDNYEVADSMIRALEMHGHQVSRAESVASARVMLDRAVPKPGFDLAILDNNLGDGYGTELLPLDFPAVGFSGLPYDMRKKAPGLTVFSKGDPIGLLDYIEELDKPLDS
jgi:hypothetical protein